MIDNNEIADALNRDEFSWSRMLTQFYRSLDSGDVDGMCELIHPEFLWLRQGKQLRSRDDVAAALATRDPQLHVFHLLSSVKFERLTSEHMRYSGYLLVLRAHSDAAEPVRMPPSGAQTLHICSGAFKRTSDGWRLCEMDAGPPRLSLDL